MTTVQDFQYVLLSSTYDSIRNPFGIEDPWGHKIYNSSKVGCRWRCGERWIVKFSGLPEHTRGTIDACPLADKTGVAVVELDKFGVSRDNAVIYNADGSERIRLVAPSGYFCDVGFEVNRFGFGVADNEGLDRWYIFDTATNKFGEWHPRR